MGLQEQGGGESEEVLKENKVKKLAS